MSAPPARSAEERDRALAAALHARRHRTLLRSRLASGEVGLADVLASEDPVWRAVRVSWLLECLPGIGPARREVLLRELGISPTRRVRGLGIHQRRALVEHWSVPA